VPSDHSRVDSREQERTRKRASHTVAIRRAEGVPLLFPQTSKSGRAIKFEPATPCAQGRSVARDHIGKVLNCIEGGPSATRIYDRYAYDKEERDALERWARP
jgi:hypothetical protein